MLELDEELQARITKLANEGDEEAAKGDWQGQIEKYAEAWKLVTDPKQEWDGCTWILGGIAEAYFQLKDRKKAKKYFEEALNCYRGEEHSVILLRLGQLCYDEGDLDSARAYLQKSWTVSEGRSFVGVPKKYRDVLFPKKQ